jgi:hypothetical protein
VSLQSNTTGNYNIGIGSGSLQYNTSGSDNIAIGHVSLYANTIGQYNTAIGAASLSNNIVDSNTAVGAFSLQSNTDGSFNTAVGYNSLKYNTRGSYNVALGTGSLQANTLGNFNTALGYGALSSDISGNDNVAIGYNSLYANKAGGNNAVGWASLANNTTGSSNLAFGYCSLFANTTGNSNTAVGNSSLANNTTASNNTAVGNNSLRYNTIGGDNTAIGADAAVDLSGNSSSYNTFLGHRANVDSSLNIYNNSTALGYNARIDASNQMVLGGALSGSYPGIKIPGSYVGINGVYNPASSYNLDVSGNLRTTKDVLINDLTVGLGGGNNASNIAFGYGTLQSNTTGTLNVAIGRQALTANQNGQVNIAIGLQTLLNNSSGSSNIAINSGALYNNTIGNYNIAIGQNSLFLNRTGSYNIGLGADAAVDLSGNSSYNTFLGQSANVDSSSNTYNFSTALGYNSIIDASNQIVLGRSSEKVKIPGSYVGINGVYNPASGFALDVSGDLQVQDGTFDIFYPNILRGLKVSPTRFNYNPKTPTNFDSFKIELDGANCRIYKGDSFDVSACVIQNTGGTGIALASGTTKLYLNNSGNNPGVGINNTNPQYTLDVSGVLHTTADALINSLTVGKGNGNNQYNTAVGSQALNNNTDASGNTAVGYQALVNTTTGIQNTAIGMYAGYNVVTGSNNTCIGYNAQQSTNTVSNEITLGDNNITTFRCYAPLTNPSDARDKKDIKPLDAGLQFVDELKPVKFIWNMRNGGKVDIPEIGFIAQDLQQVQKDTGITIPNLVYESNPDKLEVSYGTLLPILVKAVQELSIKVRALETELNELKLRFA